MNKTITPSLETIERNWFLVDAKDKTLGRLATEIATVLRGKNKPTYTPHLDTGDFVIVVNAEKVAVTGKKASQKLYRRHSGRPGGMKVEKFESLFNEEKQHKAILISDHIFRPILRLSDTLYFLDKGNMKLINSENELKDLQYFY